MSELNFYLLQINDALFPIGAYSHSQGLETYIQRGIVHDEATAKEYIHHKIRLESCLHGASRRKTLLSCCRIRGSGTASFD